MTDLVEQVTKATDEQHAEGRGNSGNNYYYKQLSQNALNQVKSLQVVINDLEQLIKSAEVHKFSYVPVAALKWITRERS